MQINVNAFQEAILAGNYETAVTAITPETLAQTTLAEAMTPVFAAFDAAIDAGKLVQADLVIESAEPTTVRLETGVINLPFADSKKVNNFLDEAELVPLTINLIVSSPYVNQSGLRIDRVATADTYVAAPAAQQAAIVASVSEKLIRIEAERTAPKPVAKPSPAQAATKRTTTRRTATKKPAAKKATTKPTAKKPAAKKPAAKKTTRKPAAKKAD
ncbi:hypothetical protein [Lacticaseibacillus daqingensis]|uniref:hypothetical protein n=1 Tax=Lacticaseibacillus daqingensis TaxID=2486014 RepID=UPI000F792531|nr:hypothetical protein [Lacticaseibacillus daqingensis]